MAFGIDDIIGAVLNIANKFIPDQNKKAEMAQEVLMSKLNGDLKEADNEFELLKAQIDVNKTEAANSSLFVSGWRPAVGWVCVISFGYVSIIRPSSEFIATVLFGYSGIFPVVNTEITLQVLFALLGIAGMRSWEKFKGVANK